jgi:hypothetical protein
MNRQREQMSEHNAVAVVTLHGEVPNTFFLNSISFGTFYGVIIFTIFTIDVITAAEAYGLFSSYGEGRSQTFIAQRVGINQSTVSRILSRYRETGGYSRRLFCLRLAIIITVVSR